MTTKHSNVLVGNNTHVVEVVVSDHNDNLLTDAVVTLVSIVDRSSGDPVGGVTVPSVLSHVADGLYRAEFEASAFVVGHLYLATLTVVSAMGVEGECEEVLVAKRRRA